jgi:Uma2 family endonuclease
MAVVNRISEQEYLELALNDEDGFWELWDGVLVEKPQMSMRHNRVAAYLGAALINQVDPGVYVVSINGDRTRISSRSYSVPDVMVIPAAYQLPPYQDDPWAIGAYREPLPLVVEVWSPTTGRYDLAVKLQVQGYRERGDLEIWYLHPRERTLRVWRKQSDGGYTEETYQGGVVSVASLPGVAVDLDALLDG